MRIERIITGPLDVNTYVVSNEGKSIIIDPGGDANKILAKVTGQIEAVLLTHGHFDHIGALGYFQDMNIDIYINHNDYDLLNNQTLIGVQYGVKLSQISKTNNVTDGQVLDLIGLKVKVLETAGHTLGGVTYMIGNSLFTGDTLFANTYGRFDLKGGDFYSIRKSIVDILFKLEGNYDVYPGHEGFTTLDKERQGNPINYDKF